MRKCDFPRFILSCKIYVRRLLQIRYRNAVWGEIQFNGFYIRCDTLLTYKTGYMYIALPYIKLGFYITKHYVFGYLEELY